MFDIFVNYRTADARYGAAATYELLAVRFGKDRIFLDHQSMAPGSNYPVALRQALESMRVLLVLIGPQWLATDPADGLLIEREGDWVRREIRRALERTVPIVPVLLDGTTLPDPTRLPADVRGLVHHQSAEVRHKYLRADVDRLGDRLADIISGDRRPGTAPPTVLDRLPPNSGPLVANVPPRNPNFTGRARLFDELHRQIQPGAAAIVQVQAQTLHGLGGVGKTQLVVEYAYRHQADFDIIWWVVAEQPATIAGQLVALARRLGIAEQPDQSQVVQELWDALRLRGRWLLVFDNAEEPEDLRRWWPPDSGRVLITSRNPGWTSLVSTVAVDVLSRTEALEFMRRRTGRDDPAFEQLVEVLGELPLALEQAAAYLVETAVGVNQYLELLAARTREMFALNQSATTEQTIASTWTVSLARLRERQPEAEDLLKLLAYLAADDIPRALPAKHHDVLPEPLQATVQDELAYQRAVAALRRYSLVKVDEENISVHRLVQATVRHSLDADQQRLWATAALSLIAAAYPAQTDDPDVQPVAARLLSHALTVTDHVAEYGTHHEETARLLHSAGIYLHWSAEYGQGRAVLECALAIREANLGPEHQDTAYSLTSLADLLRDDGDYDTARQLLERAIPTFEASLGSLHHETAYSLTSLASILAEQGELQQAQALLERAQPAYEAHPSQQKDLAYNLFTLAQIVHETGPLSRARELYERALAIWEEVLGPSHPTTAYAMAGMAAILLTEPGNREQARALLERALGIWETSLGHNHPRTAELRAVLDKTRPASDA